MTITRSIPVPDSVLPVLCDRYFLPVDDDREKCDLCGRKHETLEELFWRASLQNDKYYEMISSLDMLPNSPVFFNAGTNQGTYSACFKFDVEDSMFGDSPYSPTSPDPNSIMGTASKAASVLKWGGGVGYVFTKLRGKGDKISSTHGKACGVVQTLHHMHSVGELITQAGKRHAAQMGILSVYHSDIREFIHAKDVNANGQDAKNLMTFNISVDYDDEFMRKVKNGDEEANRLYDEAVDSSWRSGDPGWYFSDNSEGRNPTPWLGRLTGTNPCGEVPLLNNEPCNLGSINLANFVAGGDDLFDWKRLEKTTRLAIRYLDDLLDDNRFPHDDIDRMARYTRKLGLGVMGWADALMSLKIQYDSDAAISLGAKVMKFIDDTARVESEELSREPTKGPAPAFWDYAKDRLLASGAPISDATDEDLVEFLERNNMMLRNATRTCIAPTGTIAEIAGVNGGIEPFFALKFDRRWDSSQGRVGWEKEVATEDFIPHVANEIPWEYHVRMQAAFQDYTNLAVSKTINMHNSATREDIRRASLLMYDLNLTGGTIFRDGSRGDDQILVEVKEDIKEEVPTPRRRQVARESVGLRVKFEIGGMKGYFHVGCLDDGSPGELFVKLSRSGTTLQAMADGFAIAWSMALQHGAPLESLVDKFEGTIFEPNGLTKDPSIPSTTSLFDYIARWHRLRFLNGEETPPVIGDICPRCSRPTFVRMEGCQKCLSPGCGESRC